MFNRFLKFVLLLFFVAGDLAIRIARQLAEPFRFFFESAWQDSVDEFGAPIRPRWQRILLAPLYAVSSVLQTISLLFSNPTDSTELLKRRFSLRLGLPAASLTLITLCAGFIHRLSETSLHARYATELNELDPDSAPNRLLNLSNRILDPVCQFPQSTRFQVAELLPKINLAFRANGIIEQLAPEESKGFSPAHRTRALQLGSSLKELPISSDQMKSLGWHLRNSSELNDAELLELRTDYFLSLGQLDLAISSLAQLAQSQPERWFPLAELLLARRDLQGARAALTRASQYYSQRVSENPQSIDDRLRVATALARLGDLDPAIEILTAGWGFEKDIRYAQAISELYLLKFQKGRVAALRIDVLWDFLKQSLQWDPASRNVYEAMVLLAASDNAEPIRSYIRAAIEQVQRENPQSIEPLFALSNLDAQEGNRNQAIARLEQALEINADSAPARNNLAWLLATDPLLANQPSHPSLRQAEEHARSAVAAAPNTSSFHDTLGTVLLKQKRTAEAIAEFEISLKNSKNPIPTLETIAKIYEDLGETNLSKEYQQRAEQLRLDMQSGKITTPPQQ